MPDGRVDRTAGKWIQGQGLGKERREREEREKKEQQSKENENGELVTNSPYGTRSKAGSASTPNLMFTSALVAQAQRPTSPVAHKKRWSPPTPGLPTVRSDSPAEERAKAASGNGSAATSRTASPNVSKGKALPNGYTHPYARTVGDEEEQEADDDDDSDGDEAFFDVPEGFGSVRVPTTPKKPTTPLSNVVQAPSRTPTQRTYSFGQTNGEQHQQRLQAQARVSTMSSSTQATDGTTFSSLLAPGGSSVSNGGGGAGRNGNGTVRTVTTVATSLGPDDKERDRNESSSFTKTEASATANLFVHHDGKASPPPPFYVGGMLKVAFPNGFRERERRPSETAVADLSRVAEEEESPPQERHREIVNANANGHGEKERRHRPPAIHVARGNDLPDDLLDALQRQPMPFPSSAPAGPRPMNSRRRTDDDGMAFTASPLSATPPRKLALVGAARENESVESLRPFPRRPTHRPRHSVDAAGSTSALLPKERDISPNDSGDLLPVQPQRVPLRRNSTKTGASRNGLAPRNGSGSESPSPSPDAIGGRVPFPRTGSVEQPSHLVGSSSLPDAPAPIAARLPRGRFVSEADSTNTRRRPRPSSYDELGAKPTRSRIGSLVNLGAASSNASASDLLSRDRDSMDTSVRQTLIVREDGQAPTHFVSLF
ncbi:hypothetical protein BD410DRAFT_142305 [Rickenella mellea]|uniref:Uncharacterized protein n=1 Tax=Rickenella mellea TaxID=50990 RepID=A0A4Y7Q845_9AGAM|nr:hypothetical protein BD410DRAFT_142305 [Rickenella mellea]